MIQARQVGHMSPTPVFPPGHGPLLSPVAADAAEAVCGSRLSSVQLLRAGEPRVTRCLAWIHCFPVGYGAEAPWALARELSYSLLPARRPLLLVPPTRNARIAGAPPTSPTNHMVASTLGGRESRQERSALSLSPRRRWLGEEGMP